MMELYGVLTIWMKYLSYTKNINGITFNNKNWRIDIYPLYDKIYLISEFALKLINTRV